MLRSVGSGTGPTTLAPVRVTCSTMSRAATSSIRWSYARSLMRILGPATFAPSLSSRSLLQDLRDAAGADGASTLADGEAQAVFHRDRGAELDRHLDVVARHHHLDALGKGRLAGHVGGAEVELGLVAGEERGVAPTLLLG